MTIKKFIKHLRRIKDDNMNKIAVVDATSRDGEILAAFLKSAFFASNVVVIYDEKKKEATHESGLGE